MAERIVDRSDLNIAYKDNENVYGAMQDLFKGYGQKTAVKYMVGDEVIEVSSDQFFSDIRNTASELVRMGFYRKHIGIIGKNCYEWLVICLAAMYSGCISVPLSRDLNADEISELCDYADVDIVFYEKEMAGILMEFKASSAKKIYEMKAFLSGAYVHDRISDDGTVNNRTKKDDPICILFTSGTTGKSKGVVLKNSSFTENFRCSMFRQRSMLLILPFHHIAGITVPIACLGDGGVLDIGEDPKRYIKYIDKMKPGSTFVVPALLTLMTSRLGKVDYDQSKLGWELELICCGAATFPSAVIHSIRRAGIEIEQYYGATETTGGCICGLMTEENPEMIGNLIVPTMKAKIEDGELLIGGDRLFEGYYKDPEGTAKVLKDGWYHTGDLARVDEDGAWYLTGRKKNLIILSNGENISPEEIELKLGACPEINEVIVYGIDSFLHAEILPLYDGSMTEDKKEDVRKAIKHFVDKYNSSSALYKRVPFIEFRDTPFKKNASGKIMRHINQG